MHVSLARVEHIDGKCAGLNDSEGHPDHHNQHAFGAQESIVVRVPDLPNHADQHKKTDCIQDEKTRTVGQCQFLECRCLQLDYEGLVAVSLHFEETAGTHHGLLHREDGVHEWEVHGQNSKETHRQKDGSSSEEDALLFKSV